MNVSIVLYQTPIAEVSAIITTLRANAQVNEIWLIDNSPLQTEAFMFLPATYIFNNANLGYGSAHNIALRKSLESSEKYHLVLNSDISFSPEILTELCEYMDNNPHTGLLMPKTLNPDGSLQYLCKQLPSPMDLISRLILPKSINRKRNHRFEMRHTGYSSIMNVPYLSGCFMFLRTDALRTVGLFDERFFMYPEDLDLSRRIHEKFDTTFYPHVSITHAHKKASYKNCKMLFIHATNMCRYFNKWGWF